MEDQTGILATLIEDFDLRERKNEQARLGHNTLLKPDGKSHMLYFSPILKKCSPPTIISFMFHKAVIFIMNSLPEKA